jgi:hypothetical protein
MLRGKPLSSNSAYMAKELDGDFSFNYDNSLKLQCLMYPKHLNSGEFGASTKNGDALDLIFNQYKKFALANKFTKKVLNLSPTLIADVISSIVDRQMNPDKYKNEKNFRSAAQRIEEEAPKAEDVLEADEDIIESIMVT